MTTMKEVAKAAGVSVATVSNYINNTKSVSRKRGEKIADAIEKLHYIPNQMARTLKSNSNNNVGVILPNISDQYYVQIFQGMEHLLKEKGYFVSLGISNDLAEIEEKYIYDFLKNKVCGLIVITAQPENTDFFQNHILSKQIPFVHIDRQIAASDATFLTFDNQKTLEKLTEFFQNAGHQNITIFAGPQQYSCEREAVLGYERALKEGSISRVVHTILNKEAAFRNCILHFKENKPDVIITTSRLVTLGVLEGLGILGHQVPQDVMVATLGEDNWNRFHDFQNIISSSRESIFLGSRAAKLLLTQIETPMVYEPQIQIIQDKYHTRDYLKKPAPSAVKQGKKLSIMMLDTLQVDLFKGLIPYFKNVDGIDITIKTVPHQQMLSCIYQKTKETDVFMYDMPWLYSLANDDVLLDISPFMEQEDSLKDIYLKDSLEVYGKFRNKYFGLPFMYAPQILFYRKDYFQSRTIRNEFFKKYNIKLQPPRSFKEFNLISDFFCQKHNPLSPTKFGTAVSAAYEECLMPEIYMRMRSYGSQIYDERFQVVFDSHQTVKAYTNLLELLQSSSPHYLGMNDMNIVDEFLNGNIAMLITYPSFISNINDLQRSCQAGQVGVANIPGKSPVLGGWCLGISRHSQNKKEAFDFIHRACGEEMANYSTIMAGQSAVRRVFDNNELISLYPWLPLYKEVYDYAEPIIPPYTPGKGLIAQNKIDYIVSRWFYRLIHHEISVAEAVYQTHTELTKLFNDYGYRQNIG